VKNAYSISDFGRNPAAMVRRAEQKGSVTICRNGRVVGFLVSRDRMEAILETLELTADADAMKAVRQYEAGKARLKDVSCLDDDKG
jgi:prevent-host-death family protein